MNTPYYLIDEAALRRNLEILRGVRERTGCKILLAQKAFSMFAVYPIIAEYLDGATASGLFEARLAAEELQGENHVFSAAYRAGDIPELARLCDHVVFNSCAQLRAYAPQVLAAGKQAGLRINPECSTQEGHAIYDPCAPGSRLGTTRRVWDREMDEGLLSLLDGLHFHTLCEQGADALARTLDAVEARFGPWLPGCDWINFGGGHHITKPGYDLDLLCACLTRWRECYNARIYLEPGEAVALNAGWLTATVLDVVMADMPVAVLDVSAACHMPDVLEMPYRPEVFYRHDGATTRAGNAGEEGWTCRLAGKSCLAGDVVGEYGFAAPLQAGQRLVFGDMAIYSMVKTTTFNGLRLPSIGICAAGPDSAGREMRFSLLREFGYQDFRNRLS